MIVRASTVVRVISVVRDSVVRVIRVVIGGGTSPNRGEKGCKDF
jgi:hypothetical protein